MLRRIFFFLEEKKKRLFLSLSLSQAASPFCFLFLFHCSISSICYHKSPRGFRTISSLRKVSPFPLPFYHHLPPAQEEMFQGQLPRLSPFRGSFKALEADINHANTLADAIHRAYGGPCVQLRLSCSSLAPIFLHLMEWLDCTCSYSLTSYLGLFQILVYKVFVDGKTTISAYERHVSLKDFYAVMYPSLQQIESSITERDESKERFRAKDVVGRKTIEERKKLFYKDFDREDECGICLEVSTKMVLPNCNHAMCINCFRDWNMRSQSCPFCRGSLRRVRSRDLWVLTSNNDVVDTVTLQRENVRHFYHYVDSLPLIVPETLFLVFYDYVV